MQRRKLPNLPLEIDIEDNALALAVVIFSGAIALFALYGGVDGDRAKTALAVGSNGMSGVIGFIGGKARSRKTTDEPQPPAAKPRKRRTTAEPPTTNS